MIDRFSSTPCSNQTTVIDYCGTTESNGTYAGVRITNEDGPSKYPGIQKKQLRRWTRKSPNDMTHAEIDLVLTSRRWCLYETSVVPSFCTGSDHCVLRAMIRLSRMLEKKSCHRPGSTCQAVYCGDILSEILSNHDRQLKKDLTGDYELLVKRTQKLC
ncbi:hypothetical protein KIN20_014447 [Parelaphostrongylus tenuis]|uniref:Uncharacterized protein n=1 Tax=Parelaphostrongylus tenuis TaxID=148309 RepID=A0AAD5MH76_PARTN|nr:hypothetical protein KIN20_014447 [Parelaphostrongylus tenuis]